MSTTTILIKKEDEALLGMGFVQEAKQKMQVMIEFAAREYFKIDRNTPPLFHVHVTIEIKRT